MVWSVELKAYGADKRTVINAHMRACTCRNVGWLQNVDMEKNEENQLDGIQNKLRSVGNDKRGIGYASNIVLISRI